jgi:hypothetical protein
MSLWKIIREALGGKPRPRLPNFFICGAARSGTTSMWEYLRQHPDIFMPPVFEHKEPSFFCDSYGVGDWDAYLSLFAEAGKRKRVGEASGPYLTSPESPGRIKKVINDPRIVILLRNPAERAWSLFKWMHENGYEKITSFPEALEAEEKERFNNPRFLQDHGQYYPNFLYFRSGLYHDQVKRFFDTFGREPVRLLLFEEMTRDPLAAVRGLFEFLGVDASFAPKIQVHNPSSHHATFDPALRRQLLARYAPDIDAVGQLLGRDLKSVWN